MAEQEGGSSQEKKRKANFAKWKSVHKSKVARLPAAAISRMQTLVVVEGKPTDVAYDTIMRDRAKEKDNAKMESLMIAYIELDGGGQGLVKYTKCERERAELLWERVRDWANLQCPQYDLGQYFSIQYAPSWRDERDAFMLQEMNPLGLDVGLFVDEGTFKYRRIKKGSEWYQHTFKMFKRFEHPTLDKQLMEELRCFEFFVKVWKPREKEHRHIWITPSRADSLLFKVYESIRDIFGGEAKDGFLKGMYFIAKEEDADCLENWNNPHPASPGRTVEWTVRIPQDLAAYDEFFGPCKAH